MRIKKVRTQKMPCEPKKNGNGLLRLFLHSSRLSLHTSEELPPGLSVVLFVVNSEILSYYKLFYESTFFQGKTILKI